MSIFEDLNGRRRASISMVIYNPRQIHMGTDAPTFVYVNGAASESSLPVARCPVYITWDVYLYSTLVSSHNMGLRRIDLRIKAAHRAVSPKPNMQEKRDSVSHS